MTTNAIRADLIDGNQPLVARAVFPLLRDQPDLVYLDSAASAQKPASVLARLNRF